MADAISMQRLRAQAVDAYNKSGQNDILTYPKGEPDAVTITYNDMDGLQPGEYLSDNIIDFYIKYLQKTRLSSTDRDRFYFFNSFFFTKLLENRTVSKGSGQCSVDYGQLQKWTQGVDLFEKEYIIIPVIHRSHWSLILICHLTSLNRRHEESKPLPCIYHLDSMNGMHESFEREVKSYLSEAWFNEKYEGADKDQVREMTQALMFMGYVQSKVPQQDNGYNCGLYLMHNVEDILKGVKSNALSQSSNQLETCFVERRSSDVNEMRVIIRNLIVKESGVKEVTFYLKPHENEGKSIYNNDLNDFFIDRTEDDAQEAKVGDIVEHEEGQRDVQVLSDTHLDVAIKHVEDEKVDKFERERFGRSQSLQRTTINNGLANSQYDEELQDINSPQVQDMRIVKSRDISENETNVTTIVLLDCMVEGGVYFNEKKNATCWDKISERIENSCSIKLSKKQCQRRFDTLKKAYRVMKVEFCEKHNKSFSESTEEEREQLRLATTLCEEWYEKIGKICEKRDEREKARKLRHRSSPSSQSPKRRKSNHYSGNDRGSMMKTLPTMPHNLEEDFAIGPLRSSEARMGDCKERRLQLRFKNKLAHPIFTEDLLTSENCKKLIVNLEDVDTGEIVTSGPWASAVLEVFVLKLDFIPDVEENLAQKAFDMLFGELYIKLMDGEGLLGEVYFASFMLRLVKLGVRVIPRDCMDFRIEEARTEAFAVQHLGYKYLSQPTLGSEVWTLQNIRKGGPCHVFCIKMGIFTVEDLLRQKSIGITNPYLFIEEGTWKHALTCKPSGKVRRYVRDGCGIVFNHLFQAIGFMEKNGPFRAAQSLPQNEKELMEELIPEALTSWEHVVLDEGSLNFLSWLPSDDVTDLIRALRRLTHPSPTGDQ